MKPPRRSSQITGNTGLFHVARELSRLGWHVSLTIRNARGADLYAVNDDETAIHPIQSKALSQKNDVPLGTSLDRLRSTWWVVTVNALRPNPTCYVLTLSEVKSLAGQNTKDGRDSFWLPRRAYERMEFQDAWHRLGEPNSQYSEAIHQ